MALSARSSLVTKHVLLLPAATTKNISRSSTLKRGQVPWIYCRGCTTLAPTANAATTTAATTTDEPHAEVSPFEALPGPKQLPIIGNFLSYIKPSNVGRLHELKTEEHQQYGRLFRDRVGPVHQVHVSDPELIAQVFRNQGEYPIRLPFDCWVEYRKATGKPLGILTAQGKEWHRIRRILSQKMLKPKMVTAFEGELNAVLDDTVVHIRNIRDKHGDERLVREMPNELYKWAFESIGTILFETRMGCLTENVPAQVQEFIDAIVAMMSSSLLMVVGWEFHRKYNTPFWRKHERAWSKLFELSKSLVDTRLEEIRPQLENPELVQNGGSGEFLAYLLASKQISMQEIYVNVMEVMLGGIDTTSNTLCFVLYLLAQHPDVQQKLHDEVRQTVGDRAATAEDVKSMNYLKCVVKETMRLYPVVTMNVRLLADDIVLDGYNIPKMTLFILNMFAACRDERVFENASDFLPERWDRNTERSFNPFAALSFGFGTRSCIGRRVAELELYLALARMSQQFEILPYEGIEFKTTLRTVLTPGNGVPVRLRDR